MINSNTPSYRYFSPIIKAQLPIQIIAQIVFFLKGRQGKGRIPWRCITNPDPSIQMCRWYFAGCCFSSCTHFFFLTTPPHCTFHTTFCFAKLSAVPIQPGQIIYSNQGYSLSSGLSSIWILSVTPVGPVWCWERCFWSDTWSGQAPYVVVRWHYSYCSSSTAMCMLCQRAEVLKIKSASSEWGILDIWLPVEHEDFSVSLSL